MSPIHVNQHTYLFFAFKIVVKFIVDKNAFVNSFFMDFV